MKFKFALITSLICTTTALVFAAPPADVKAKVDKKIAELQSLSTDATIVAEVKAYNTTPPAATKDMTNDKWKTLTVLSPEVRDLTKNKLATYLKTKKTAEIDEFFVSGNDGGKVGFLAKPSNWCHKGKPKHDVAMTGKTWIGEVEMDESSGKQSIQFSIPVLDGGKAIGSIVIGLAISELK